MNDDLCISYSGTEKRIVLLHGWGADAEDLLPLGKQLINFKGNTNTAELVSLHAPQVHPEGLGRQWYGLFPHDWNAVPIAVEQLISRLKCIASQSLIPLEKTVLFGFSQGGAMALHAGTSLPVAGIICCSAFPHPEWIAPKLIPPVFLTHGTEDIVVPFEASQKLMNLLMPSSLNVELSSFKGGHEIPSQLVPKFRECLEKWC